MASSKGKDSAITQKALNFQIRESYKAARTNIDYSIIKKGCKKIAFTSSAKGEGKTITAMNIALALAQQVETKVLVVECDLRRPHVHSALDIAPTPGITNYLNEECTREDIIQQTKIPNLYAVCYGAIPPNPSELLSSDAMQDFIKSVEKDYNYIIFDTPPVGVVIDAIPIIKASDGVVVVIRNNSTTYPQLKITIDTLNRAGSKILGVVVNRVKPESRNKKKYYSGDYYYYGY
ncbi:CpsD/CapB family tyrosine-protein kinase [Ruminococcus sp. YE282]|jgi:capsular exopolysaccharide synthesis family protein|uniref:CpsD/CapB family tyrosine-protein kinase n=1 Tax=Ruminococcus sp. YE282 TaxID=3158780 RepID=UPI0008920FB2|nr:CpsD/CapB family tyrosine-protein kinase [Ruminococcus bromii]MEE3498199.1 CpsD/CapB family tyrosine-protein kinase [Ruminococcus bromii]SCY35999.1 capsular exopolysaccharide family [Ruminococcus bromii]HCB94239.1 capsular biosynthesis protein [Ruminococcus sp.]